MLLAIVFAKIQNPDAPPSENTAISKQPSSAAQPEVNRVNLELITAGGRVFVALRFARCHSIAGEGNPRYPLDGVGKRRTAESIRQWVLASTKLKDQLPAAVFQIKQTYRNQSRKEIDALVMYLQSI